MIGNLLAISLVELVVFGGGGIFVPVFENLYVDVFHLMSVEDYYNLVSMVNIFPGVTGGKLAAYMVGIDYGLLGSIIASIFFIIIPLVISIYAFKYIDKLKQHPLYQQLNAGLKPVLIGCFISIGISFFSVGANNINPIVGAIYLLVSLVLIKKFKINLVYLIIFGLVFNIVLLYFHII